jgi:uncharacterized protein YjiS (DUF1127 family)
MLRTYPDPTTLAGNRADATSRPSPADHWRAWLSEAAATAWLWLDRGRSRRDLAELNDYELRDIGLTRVDAQYESAKPFWRP